MKEFLDIYRYLVVGDIDKDVFISFLTKIEGMIPVTVLTDHIKKELENDSDPMKRIIHTLIALELELTKHTSQDVHLDEPVHVATEPPIPVDKKIPVPIHVRRQKLKKAFGEIIATDNTYHLREKLLSSIEQINSGFRTKNVAEIILEKYKQAKLEISEASAHVYARKYILYLIKKGVLEEKTKDYDTTYYFIDAVKDKTVFEKFQDEILTKAEELNWRAIRIEDIESSFPEKTEHQVAKALSALIAKKIVLQFHPKNDELRTAELENKPKPKGYIHFKPALK